MARRRSSEEIQQVVERFHASGLLQMMYCRETGVVRSSLGRYLRRMKHPEQRLVQVKVEAPSEFVIEVQRVTAYNRPATLEAPCLEALDAMRI